MFQLRWQDIVDILIISFIVYRLLLLLVGTRAIQLIKGLLLLIGAGLFAKFFGLRALSWLLDRFLAMLFIAIPIVFQPELRKMLEELGKGGFKIYEGETEELKRCRDELLKALLYLKEQRIGAIIVLQRETGLREHWLSAVKIGAPISYELLVSIFWPGNPLHDGAAIIDQKVIVAASCYLPLTDKTDISRWLGTRHRAALGISEVSDALVIVVSEERGEISIAVNGHLSRNLNEDQLKALLTHYYFPVKKDKVKGLEKLKEGLNKLFGGGSESEA